jgi:polyribonucleotide nucleotidyltransferase
MNSTISQPKSEVSEFAPRMETIEIDPDAIRTIIGPSGKMIKKITEETGTDIEIADDGKITIAAKDPSAMAAAKKWIYELAPKIEIGQVFEGTVKRIADFGAFVEIVPNKDGLVHISQLAEYRVNKVTDIVKEGDKLLVKVIDIDKDGKIRLSHKEAARDQETV